MKRTVLKLTTLLLAIALTLSACKGAASGSTAEKAPDFSLPAMDGKTVSLTDFKGKPVFINFWETS